MLLKHSSIYLFAKAIPAVVGFTILSLYTHLLTPDEYGLYTLIFTATIFLHNTLFNWLVAGTLRFWSIDKYPVGMFISTLFKGYSRVLLLLFIPFIILLFIYWGEPAILWMLSGLFLLLAFALYTITQNLLTAQLLPVKYAKLTISYSLMSLSIGGTLAYMGYGAIGIIIGLALAYIIPSLFVFNKIGITYQKNLVNNDLFKKFLVYGIPISSAFILEELTKSADRFMLAAMHDKAQAGIYAVGYDLSGNSILLIMSAINLAAYPVVIKLLDTEGKKVALDYFRKYVILLIGIALPSVMGLILVGPDLVYLVIGEKYQQAVILLLPWITIGVFMMGLESTYFALAFQLGHYTIGLVKVGIVITATNLVLNYLLIPKMAMQGAAIATLSSFAIGVLISSYYGRKHFALPFPAKDFFIIVLATLFMGFCLWWLKDMRGWGSLLLQLSVGLLSYFAIIYAFDLLDIRKNIKSYLGK